jgi:DNA polymerase III epsilon subunit-like protein
MAPVPWTEQPIHFVDFEGSLSSGILEYGVVTLAGGAVSAARTRLCAATGRVRRQDTAVHGISAGDVRGIEAFSSEWELFAGLREKGPFAAHYAGAENSLLRSAWPYPRSCPDFARPGQLAAEWGPWIDSARIYGQLYPTLPTGRLEALVGACSLQGELDALAAVHCPQGRRRYHAALYDALAGALLLTSLARNPQTAALTVPQLLALSTLDPGRRESILQRELF